MNLKMMLGTVAIVGLIAIPIVAAVPMQAYTNKTADVNMLRTQDQDRLRTRDYNCTCDGAVDNHQIRLRLHECVGNRTCNCAEEMEQYKYQCRHQNGGN